MPHQSDPYSSRDEDYFTLSNSTSAHCSNQFFLLQVIILIHAFAPTFLG
uniref:Uncharacterized protein n=1 Tax=Anguilla anguilla TaxID=7936 RepID=A0A0E9VH68_ANGAN